MKKFIFLFLIAFLLVPALAQAACNYDSSEIIDQGGMAKFEKGGQPVTGTVCSHYKGRLLTEMPYKSGKKDGVYKTYHGSGKLLSETNFKAGKREGRERMYYENGKVLVEVHYKADVWDGPYREYDANGKMATEVIYKNGSVVSNK